jgi:hypothetical protein
MVSDLTPQAGIWFSNHGVQSRPLCENGRVARLARVTDGGRKPT